ncbi:DUF3427 domain-containing protein [bacterium]|nr:DUF3427 domain-containing protein [bacterium]
MENHLVLNQPSRGKVIKTLKSELKSCCEFWFYVAFLNREGLQCLKQELLEAESNGVRGRVLVSKYLDFTDPEALRDLLRFSNLELKIAQSGNMHAKGYFFIKEKSETYLIGSSNWTASALTCNTELNVLITASRQDELADSVREEFLSQFDKATSVTEEFVRDYEENRKLSLATNSTSNSGGSWAPPKVSLQPNDMQLDAINGIEKIRSDGEKKALVVSATGTGKTYLSAFHAKQIGVKRLLFVVHRENIARKAMESYKRVFGDTRTYGLYTGNTAEPNADFVFSTVQTLSRTPRMEVFAPDTFDYIIVDESHRVGANSYAKFLNYFDSKFLLGMTATPERTDGRDIFQFFDFNVAYEIRLQRALEEEMLCPFHYFGIADVLLEGESVDADTPFNLLGSDARIEHILYNAKRYGHSGSRVRGLIFCSRVEEATLISEGLNRRGLKTVALSGKDSEDAREEAIRRLEAHDSADALDYIVTVDIFNEGVDIPSVNQILMLRPTQSAIIFVQQLGRGLRKVEGQDKYLTVVDFIGNYLNNYLIPIALYGDTTNDRDQLRRLVFSGDAELPGTSTVSFDKISRDRIFESINQTNSQTLKELRSDFTAIHNRLGRLPVMMDFFELGARDPRQFGKYVKGSYRDFVRKLFPDEVHEVSNELREFLAVLGKDGLNGRSIEEPLIVLALLKESSISFESLLHQLESLGLPSSEARLLSAARAVNLRFLTETVNKKKITTGEKLGVEWVYVKDSAIHRAFGFTKVESEGVADDLRDMATFAKAIFLKDLDLACWENSFVRHRKYSRSDVFRLLGYPENPVAQNVGGYLLAQDRSSFPIFVTYHKSDEISSTTKYEDHFKSPSVMHWFSKSRRTLESPDVRFLADVAGGFESQVQLFVKKNDDDGIGFYYLGHVCPKRDSFYQDEMPSDKGAVKVVRLDFELEHAVPRELYEYLLS